MNTQILHIDISDSHWISSSLHLKI
jgi:hypothetical protein